MGRCAMPNPHGAAWCASVAQHACAPQDFASADLHFRRAPDHLESPIATSRLSRILHLDATALSSWKKWTSGEDKRTLTPPMHRSEACGGLRLRFAPNCPAPALGSAAPKPNSVCQGRNRLSDPLDSSISAQRSPCRRARWSAHGMIRRKKTTVASHTHASAVPGISPVAASSRRWERRRSLGAPTAPPDGPRPSGSQTAFR